MTDRQRDKLLTEIARDIQALRRHLEGEPNERPAQTRKRDPRKLYGDSNQ